MALEDAGLSGKWDIAIMSSKGVPNAATCNVGANLGVPVLALHDFDYAGFKIVKTLRRGAQLSTGIGNLIDIGLRMDDVRGMEAEPDSPPGDAKRYLQSCGATPEECDFLATQRVELNVMSTEELIAFLEKKFQEHGVKKIIPDDDTLRKAYRRALYFKELIKKAEEIKAGDPDVPEDLKQQISLSLEEDASQSWDDAIWSLVEDEDT